MKKVTLVLVMLLVSMLVLTGCKGKEKIKETIIGSWNSEGYIYTFNNDNTGSYSYKETSMPFTYEDNSDKVVIQFDGSENINTYHYRFENGNLIMKNNFNEDVTYTKVKK